MKKLQERTMENLRISHYVERTKVLGPFVRSALWVNGCCFHCDGCIAEEMNQEAPTILSVSRLADVFWQIEDTEGITISGGEPFLQAGSLLRLVQEIRKKRDYGVIVYTGFTLEELLNKNDRDIHAFLAAIDILIDGPYQKDLDDGIPYRGSSNQTIHMLSRRYENDFAAYYQNRPKRDIEINFTSDHVYLVGVPSEYGLKTWRELKKKAGCSGDGI